MDNNRFDSMDKAYTKCSWFYLVESNKRRPTKNRKEVDVLLLKNPYYPKPTKELSVEFQIFLGKCLRITQI